MSYDGTAEASLHIFDILRVHRMSGILNRLFGHKQLGRRQTRPQHSTTAQRISVRVWGWVRQIQRRDPLRSVPG